MSCVRYNVTFLSLQVPNINCGNITEISKAVLVYSDLTFSPSGWGEEQYLNRFNLKTRKSIKNRFGC